MNSRTSNARGAGVAALSLTVALVAASGTNGLAQSSESASHRGLAGAWAVQVTLRDCATNAPLGPPFNSLATFHRGGTLSESPGSLAFAIGQRSAGHGTWTRSGARTYRQQIAALILFTTPPNLPGTPGFNPTLPVSPGFFAGWQTITQTVTLNGPDHSTSAGTNAFYKSDGTLYRTGCSTALGDRLE